MDVKNKLKPFNTEIAQIIEKEGMNDEELQRLSFLVNCMKKVINGQDLEKQLYKDQEVNSSTTQGSNSEQESRGFVGSIPVIGKILRPYEIQVFIPIQTPTTDNFSSAVTTLCKEMSLKCILCYNSGQLQRKFPLVVVCPISSRFEPDIDLALNSGIEYKKPFVALVLHSGLESSLPRLPTSTKLANQGKYQNIEFIDIAFSIEAKLYKCQMNETAKKQLETFVTGFYKK